MNPLTLVKRTQKITARETALGISEEASWHAKYRDSAYIFVGGIPFDLTEGDLLAVFAQYGEIVDVNLVRDKGTGKSKGFAFIAYEDQRSTILAVDNLNGAQILGRIIRVDHCSNYKKKAEEDEETERQKREARGVCRAFQRGECTRGAGCKFSHDEHRAANTGWGPQDRDSRWGHDKFEDSRKFEKRAINTLPNRAVEPRGQERFKSSEYGAGSRLKGNERHTAERLYDESSRRDEKRSRKYNDDEEPYGLKSREARDKREDRRSSRRDDYEYGTMSREDREEKTSKQHDYHEPDQRTGDYNKREERREDRDGREYKRSRRHDDPEYEPTSREYGDKEEKRSVRRDDAAVERMDGEGLDKREERRSMKHVDKIDRRSRHKEEGRRLRRHDDDHWDRKKRD